MALNAPEQAAMRGVLTPEKLMTGTSLPPHEQWAKDVLNSRNLTDKEFLKRKIAEGEEIILDTTESDIQGIRGRANGIGKDVDPNTGDRIRAPGSEEAKQHKEAMDGAKMAEDLLKYETLDPTRQKEIQDEVVKALEELAGGKDFFQGVGVADRKKIADKFIRTHKKDIVTLFRENSKAINTEDRFNSLGASDDVFTREQELQVAQLELENANAQVTELGDRVQQLKDLKDEFDHPAIIHPGGGGPLTYGNVGGEKRLLEAGEPVRNQDINKYHAELEKLTIERKQIEDQIKMFGKNPKWASKKGMDIQKLQDKQKNINKDYKKAKTNFDNAVTDQRRLEFLRQQEQALPKEIETTQAQADAKKIEAKQKEIAHKKAADYLRRAKERKEMVDEDLATVTRDLTKNVIKVCAGKELQEMYDLIMSPEGLSAIQAELLTKLDKETEGQWTELHRRPRWGSAWGGRLPRIPWVNIREVPLPNRRAIETAFNTMVNNPDSVSGTVAGIIGANIWANTPLEQQHELEAAYVTKLVIRRTEAIGMTPRREEIRAIRSGPYGDTLITQGLLKNYGFKQELARSERLRGVDLEHPNAEAIQRVKGELDSNNLLSLLMLGLAPLSMMKQKEENV